MYFCPCLRTADCWWKFSREELAILVVYAHTRSLCLSIDRRRNVSAQGQFQLQAGAVKAIYIAPSKSLVQVMIDSRISGPACSCC